MSVRRLRDLAGNATPRPWRMEASEGEEGEFFVVGRKSDGFHIAADHLDPEDAAFIVALANAADELIAVAEAARDLADAQGWLNWSPEAQDTQQHMLCRALARLDAKTSEDT